MSLIWLFYFEAFAILILLVSNNNILVKIYYKNNTLEVTTIYNPVADLGRSNKKDVFSSIEETELPSSLISNDSINIYQ